MSKTEKKKSRINKKPIKKKNLVKKKLPTKKKLSAKKKKPVTKKAKAKKHSKQNELNCFLTTACVSHYGLKDNGYYLNTLRNFRDGYLLSNKQNALLVKDYYQIAPTLVKKINANENKKLIYKFIFNKIKKACLEIKQKQFEKAKLTYINLVKNVQVNLASNI